MPKLPAARYTPGRSLFSTVVVPVIAIPGIDMFAFSCTLPTSTSSLLRVERNSMRNWLSPVRNAPVGFESVMARSPVRTVCSTAPPGASASVCGAADIRSRIHHAPAPTAITMTIAAGTQRGIRKTGATSDRCGRSRYSWIQ